MRTEKQYKRDTYYLNLTKEVSVFTMMAYSLFNNFMMTSFGPMIAVLAIVFMFIPRQWINELLDKEEDGTRERKETEYPKTFRNFIIALNLTKFISLVVLTLYMILNYRMMETFGITLLYGASLFMVIPRKLIYMWSINKQPC